MRELHKWNRHSALVTATVLMTALSASLQAQETAAEAPTSLTETYRDWVVRCETPAPVEGQTANRICEMTQELQQGTSGQRILALSIQTGGEGATSPRLTIVAPFGILLAAGLTVAVDEEPVLSAGFRTCMPAGCFAPADLTDAQMTALQNGSTATITLTNTNNQLIEINASLAGFTAAWNRLKAL